MKNAKAILVVVAVVLVGWMAGTARADFVKMGSEHLDVATSHDKGILYNSSTADVLYNGYISSAYINDEASLNVRSGGKVYNLYAYNTSTVDITGGTVDGPHSPLDGRLYAYDSSTVDITGGTVDGRLYAYDSSTVDITGGTVDGRLYAYDSSTVDITGGDITDPYGSGLNASDSSTVDISGGTVDGLYASGTTTVTIHGYDFRATAGLTLDGDKVLGTGILTGKWYGPDDTAWAMTISGNAAGATILAVPEPATLSLLALGGLALLRRRRRMA